MSVDLELQAAAIELRGVAASLKDLADRVAQCSRIVRDVRMKVTALNADLDVHHVDRIEEVPV
jgi:hypothetical protein